jgi:hypothetical protein
VKSVALRSSNSVRVRTAALTSVQRRHGKCQSFSKFWIFNILHLSTKFEVWYVSHIFTQQNSAQFDQDDVIQIKTLKWFRSG